MHDYDVKPPNATICGGREHRTTQIFLFLFELGKSPENVAYIWQIEWVPTDAIKFEDESTAKIKMVFSDRFSWWIRSQFCMPSTSEDIGNCIVDATSHPVKIALHKLILNQIFVKPGLNGLTPAKLMLAIVLEPKKQ